MSEKYLAPYINFQGRAREAMEFYQSVLGGKVDVRTHDERVTHCRLDAYGGVIIGSDGHPKFAPQVGDNIALALGGSDKDRLTKAFHGLAEGGQIKGPLSKQGDVEVGYLLDKFGINWQVRIENS